MKNPIVVQYFYDTISLRMGYNALLEQEIPAMIQDENTTQVLSIESRAVGGAKLLVDEQDYQRASQVLLDIGIMKASDSQRDFRLIHKLKQKTASMAFLGGLDSDLRLTIIFGFIFTVIFLVAVLYLMV